MAVSDEDRAAAPEVVAIGRRGRDAMVQLTLRTGALRVISLVGTVVLARILLPADFGAFALIAFLVGALAPIGDLGLGAALIQQRDRPTTTDIATVFTSQQVAWLVLFAAAWVAAPLIGLAGPDLPPDADWMLRITAVGIYVNQLRAVPVAMMTRVLRFGPLAAIEVVQQIVYVVVAVAVALGGGGVWSFVIALVAHFCLGTLLTFAAWGRLPGLGIDRPTLGRLFGFGLSYQSSNVLNAMREAVVPVFGGLAGGVVGIGFLNFGQRLGRLLGGIEEVVGRVAFPTFSRLQGDERRISLALLHVVETTALILSALLGWAIAVAPTLIPLVFSERWEPAVPVFQLAAASVLASVPASFLRGLGFAAGRSRTMVAWSTLALAATFVAFPILLVALGLVGGGLGFVLHSTLLLLGFAYATRRIVPFPWLRMGRIYVIGAVGGVAAAATLLFIDGLAGLVVSGLVFGATYGLLLLAFERSQIRRSWQLVRGRTALEAP